MDNVPHIVTQADLIEHGLSDYMVREIVQGLDFSRRKNGLRLYTNSDIVAAIESKIAKSRTRPMTSKKLQFILARLKGESNLIKVDFLKNLSLEERVETLKTRIDAADKSMKANVLKEYEQVQKRVQVALTGSKLVV
ncbi:MAG: hypothetical protein HEQ10_11130 [Dolichospermum sp. DEX182a]|jgi:hypothetical protein|nr:hypothetical protein [Dolichospermum sp. DEX182a]QSV64490.1 MAG: hypothetical protein HEQ26_18810 [Dolichospermum sp. DL01]